MPIKMMADASKAEIQKALADITLLTREEIAEKCGVTVDGINSWVRKGKIPLVHWEKLQELRITQVDKLGQPGLLEASPIVIKEKDISIFSDSELIAELKKRLLANNSTGKK